MNEEHRTALRIANLVRDQAMAEEARRLAALASPDQGTGAAITRYLDVCRRVAKAQSRHWFAAARHTLAEARAALEDLHYEVENQRRHPQEQNPPVSTLGDIVRDLEQLDKEFGGWQFNEDSEALSVQTERIELEEIDLGPFRIELRLRDLKASDPLGALLVIAQEPNGAGGQETVTHPHVSDQRLCAGEATSPIHAAVRSGRICDVFILARSVLQTYNPHSAYVRLEEWSGEPCHDCGHVMDSEESFFCERCEHNFCASCTSYCRQCQDSACLGCLETCPDCEERTCTRCMKTCRQCGHPCCAGCVIEGLCPSCHEEKENDHDTDEHDERDHDHDEQPAGARAPALASAGQAA